MRGTVIENERARNKCTDLRALPISLLSFGCWKGSNALMAKHRGNLVPYL
jgi:hypothetical protein